METSTITFRVPREIKASLEAMAKSQARSVSQIMMFAAQQVVEESEAKKRMVAEAMAEADKGLFIPGDEVMAWFNSLGTDQELPKPQARKLDR